MADKKPAKEETADEPAAKTGMAGLAMLAVAAMAGSFGISYFTAAAAPEPAETCSVEDTAHIEKAAVPDKDLAFVPLPDILTTIGSEPATRYLKMNVTVATHKDSTRTVDENKLVIIDAFISYLRSVELTDFENPDFYGHMREQLAHRSKIILGPDVSEGVLITEFLIR